MSSASKLLEVAVTEYPYVSAKEKAVRNVQINNKLVHELVRLDLKAKDVIRWELQLFNIMYAEFEHGRGCLGNVNLNKITIDENKQLYFRASDKEFVSENYDHELKLVHTMIATHDEIYNTINERERSKSTNMEVQILKIISDYFYAAVTRSDCQRVAYHFITRCEHLAEMIDDEMINVLSGIMAI